MSSNGNGKHQEYFRKAQERLPVMSVDLAELQQELAPDPHFAVRGQPPGGGRVPVPHIYTFSGVHSNAAKVYLPSDEALRNSRDNAVYMRNDPVVMECVDARQRASALLDWEILPEDDRSTEQKQLCEELTKIIRKIRRFNEYRRNLLHAVWYGKYAIQHEYRWNRVGGNMRVMPWPYRTDLGWLPVDGDKLVFRFDDGTSEHMPGQVGIRVSSAKFKDGDDVLLPRGSGRKPGKSKVERIEGTSQGLAYFLPQYERNLLAIHKHEIEDAPWERGYTAGSIHGVGVRSRIYWAWMQKQELLGFLIEYLERSAGGIEIWSYPQGNPAAKEAVQTAAKERVSHGRNIIFFPKPLGEDAMAYDVNIVEPGMAGIEAVKQVLTEYFGHQIKRYILGQTLSSEADATGLGSGLAELHMDSFFQIITYDARNLEETITYELLDRIKRWNFQKARHIDVRFSIKLDDPSVEERLNGLKTAWEMGCKLSAQEVMELVGASVPGPDDEVLQNPQIQQAEMQAQMGGMFGGPGPQGIPQDGDADGVAGEGQPANLQQHINETLMGDMFPEPEPSYDTGEREKVGEYAKKKDLPGQKKMDWDESEHPRAADGKFGSGTGSGKKEAEEKAEPAKAKKPASGDEQIDHKERAKQEWKEHGVKSQSFKSWFGDWENDPASASKVVDPETGEPKETHGTGVKAVYHGTTADGDFDAFDKSKIGTKAIHAGKGFYFAENEAIAKNFAVKHEVSAESNWRPKRVHGKVITAYLNIKNPCDLDAVADMRDVDKWADAAKQVNKDFDAVDFKQQCQGMAKFLKTKDQEFTTYHLWRYADDMLGDEHKSISDVVQLLGHDGLAHTAKDDRGAVGSRVHHPDNFGRVWIAFEPNQIKSVDNEGTFDPNDDRMRYEKSGERWITIGADDDGEGGTPVMLDGDGQIAKGPASLKNKTLSDLDRKQQETGQAADYQGKRKKGDPHKLHSALLDAHKDSGFTMRELRGAVNDAWETHRDYLQTRERAKDRIRQMTGLNAGSVGKLENTYTDHSSRKRFDEAARSLATEFPGLGLDPENAAADVWELLKEGKSEIAKHSPEIIREAVDMLRAGKRRKSAEKDKTRKALESVPFAKGKWEESKHPRDDEGQFTDTPEVRKQKDILDKLKANPERYVSQWLKDKDPDDFFDANDHLIPGEVWDAMDEADSTPYGADAADEWLQEVYFQSGWGMQDARDHYAETLRSMSDKKLAEFVEEELAGLEEYGDDEQTALATVREQAAEVAKAALPASDPAIGEYLEQNPKAWRQAAKDQHKTIKTRKRRDSDDVKAEWVASAEAKEVMRQHIRSEIEGLTHEHLASGENVWDWGTEGGWDELEKLARPKKERHAKKFDESQVNRNDDGEFSPKPVQRKQGGKSHSYRGYTIRKAKSGYSIEDAGGNTVASSRTKGLAVDKIDELAIKSRPAEKASPKPAEPSKAAAPKKFPPPPQRDAPPQPESDKPAAADITQALLAQRARTIYRNLSIPQLHEQVGGTVEGLKSRLWEMVQSRQIILHPYTQGEASLEQDHPQAKEYVINAAEEHKYYVSLPQKQQYSRRQQAISEVNRLARRFSPEGRLLFSRALSESRESGSLREELRLSEQIAGTVRGRKEIERIYHTLYGAN